MNRDEQGPRRPRSRVRSRPQSDDASRARASSSSYSTSPMPPVAAEPPQDVADPSRLFLRPEPPPGTPRGGTTPTTPGAYNETETEYFPNLQVTPTMRSRSSGVNLSRPVSGLASGASSLRPTSQRQRRPSIRIRRTSTGSTTSFPNFEETAAATAANSGQVNNDGFTTTTTGRPRASSQPTPGRIAPPAPTADMARNSRRMQPQIALPRLTEEGSRPTMAELGMAGVPRPASPIPDEDHRPGSADSSQPQGRLNRRRNISRFFWPGNRQGEPKVTITPEQAEAIRQENEYNEDLVDLLDVIDPEVQTLSTLTNVQNSLFVPDLGRWVNRRPTYTLTQYDPERPPFQPPAARDREQELPRQLDEELERAPTEADAEFETVQPGELQRSNTITSRLSDSHYAALPHGVRLEGWTEDQKWELDDHVRHMLHSKRSRFKRSMRGFGQYVRRPLGFFVTLYAVLITLFGLIWVLFQIGWISVGDKQVYTIHVIDSVLVALFAIMGDGLAPFRVVDTYHTIFIVHYTRKMLKEKKRRLAKCAQDNDCEKELEAQEANQGNAANTSTDALAISNEDSQAAVSDAVERVTSNTAMPSYRLQDMRPIIEQAKVSKSEMECDEEKYLTPEQLKTLRHHQKKLSRSHSFYKPHETFTHNPFPLNYLLAIIILLDGHSCLQISLGATTWGIDYHHRSAAITTSILCVSITANLTAGFLISFGDKKTRKKEIVNLLNRQELTEEAIKHLEHKRAKRAKKIHEVGTEESQGSGVLVEEP